MKKHRGAVTITRPMSSTGDGIIEIEIKDREAVTRVVTAYMKLEDFAKMMTGLAYVDCMFTTGKLDVVGKQREHTSVVFEMPPNIGYNDRQDVAKHLFNTELEGTGWVLHDSFSSRDSFFTEGGKEYARASVVRWVEKDG